jgi:hypothetical protein
MLIGIACAALAILMVRAAQSLLAARIQRQTGPAPAMQPLSTHQPIRSRRAQDDHSPD